MDCRIILLNGDRIQGRYLGQDREVALLRTGNEQDVKGIHGKYIDRVNFGIKKRMADKDYRIQLSAEEQILGDVLELSEGQMVLKTLWADRLVLDSRYLHKVQAAHPLSQVIYHGPAEPEKWVYAQQGSQPKGLSEVEGKWVLREKGAMAHTFPLINLGLQLQLRVDVPVFSPGELFTIEWDVEPPKANEENAISGRVVLTMNSQKLWVDEVAGVVRGNRLFGRGRVTRGSMRRPPSGIVNMLFEFDPENFRHRVKVNGALLAEWQMDAVDSVQKAYAPRLKFGWNFEEGARLKIDDLLLVLNDHPLPEESVEVPKDAEAVLFHNGDSLQVHWEGVDAEGNWNLALTDLQSRTRMHPERIRMWIHQGDSLKHIRRMAAHVEVKLSGGEEYFVAELLAADGEFLTLKREGWVGTYRIPVRLIEQLKFNPYF
ncbi:hypothetical protein P0Y35_17020 [Kiritimatiellaeota bacterium B1221]|nr:hypothetical protein [Kiritimatiellaeota bacterium B1221]